MILPRKTKNICDIVAPWARFRATGPCNLYRLPPSPPPLCIDGIDSRGLLVASLGHFSGMAGVYQAAVDKPNGSSVESGPGYLGSMSVCGVAQWAKITGS